jgi:hypothetical protein
MSRLQNKLYFDAMTQQSLSEADIMMAPLYTFSCPGGCGVDKSLSYLNHTRRKLRNPKGVALKDACYSDIPPLSGRQSIHLFC